MVDYVEEATLRLNDQASQQINTINGALRTLFATARQGAAININQRQLNSISSLITNLQRGQSHTLNVTAPGLDRIANDARAITAMLTAAGRSRTIRLNQGQDQDRSGRHGSRIQSSIPTVSTGNYLQDIAAHFGNSMRETFSAESIGRTMGRTFMFAISGELYQAGRAVISAAGAAPMNLEDARARARIAGRSAEEVAILEGIATDISSRYQQIPTAEILANTTEVLGYFGDMNDPANAELARRTMERMAREATILMASQGLNAQQASEQARLAEKEYQILGVANQPDIADTYSDAVMRATIASGGDLMPAEGVRTIQQLGSLRFALSPEALQQVLLARDEGGRMAPAEFRMGFQDLIRGSLSNENQALQIAAGLRDDSGRSIVAEQFAQDPLQFANDVIRPALLRSGLTESDLTNGVAVADAIENALGFTTSGARILTAMITQYDSRMAEFERSNQVDPQYAIDSPTTRMRGREVRAQFENMAGQALDVILPVVNTGLSGLAEAMNSLSETEIMGPGNIVAAGIAFGSLGIMSALEGISNPQTRPLSGAALALLGSASALSSAAGALTASAVANGGVDAVRNALGGGLLGRLLTVARFGAYGAVGTAAYTGVQQIAEGGIPGVDAMGNGTMTPEAYQQITGTNDLPPGMTPESFNVVSELTQQLIDARMDVDEAMLEFQNQVMINTSDEFRAARQHTIDQLVAQREEIRAQLNEAIGGDQELLDWAYAHGLQPSALSESPPAVAGNDVPNSDDLFASFEIGAITMQQAFESGVARLEGVGAELEASGSGFGAAAAGGMLGQAAAIGTAIGQAAAAQISTARVATPGGAAPAPRLDTGPSTPF